jgi:hypothetical protein
MDKNYLLEEAQLCLQGDLLHHLVEEVKAAYLQMHNPLHLADSFSIKIQTYKSQNITALSNFYIHLAAVYRFKWGNSQLEFLWDGADHFEKYKADWKDFFEKSTQAFCREELFIQAVLDLTVFATCGQAELTESRMNHFMLKHFELKMHKSKGIIAMKVA